MRFMMILKASKACEEGKPVSEELLAAMAKYNEELVKAGALVEISGLQPSSKGVRVKFTNGKVTVTDGPFPETKELIGGYWIIEVKSKQEAIEWAKRVPHPATGEHQEGEIEIRPFQKPEDFKVGQAVEQARKVVSRGK